MKTKLYFIILSLSLSFCFKANLNNIADPSKTSGILYAYSLVPIGLTGSQEVIPVALATDIINFPATIDNGTTANNIEIKFNKTIDSDTTVTIRTLDSIVKINGLDEVTLSFTKANARSPQLIAISALSESLTDIEVTLEFESPLVAKTKKIIKVKNSANQQAFIVRNRLGDLLVSGLSVNSLPGDQYIYSLALKYKPKENVTISLEAETYLGSPTIDKVQLVFTPQNYNIPQSFTVSMPFVSDTLPTYNRSYSVYAKWSASSIGFLANYNQNITPTIVVSGSTTMNKGSLNNLGISLSHMPDSNRSVNVTLSQSNFLSLDKTTFTFTPANYNIPQNLQVNISSLDYIFGAVTATFATTGGYSSNPIIISINDPSNSYLDVSGSDLIKSGRYPSIALDSVNSRILIARTYYPSSGGNDYYFSQLRLSICNIDLSSCITKDISSLAGQGNGSGNYPSIVVDTLNSKILISTENYANNSKPSLFICSLDGSSCIHKDISAGRGNQSGLSPKILIDTVNNKILLLTRNSEAGFGDRLSLFRCDLDGTNCLFTDISAGKGDVSAFGVNSIAAGLDFTNSKLLVVTQNNFTTNNKRPSLFRCNLDGSNCNYTDISAGQGDNSGRNPSLAIDSVNGKLFVTTSKSNGIKYTASLFKCGLDGTSCSHVNLGAVFDAEAYGNTVFIDQANAKVLVATAYSNNGSNYFPGLYRCTLNMTNCSFNTLALTGESMFANNIEPNIDLIIDNISATPRILVAAATNMYTQKSSLIRILRNYVD